MLKYLNALWCNRSSFVCNNVVSSRRRCMPLCFHSFSSICRPWCNTCMPNWRASRARPPTRKHPLSQTSAPCTLRPHHSPHCGRQVRHSAGSCCGRSGWGIRTCGCLRGHLGATQWEHALGSQLHRWAGADPGLPGCRTYGVKHMWIFGSMQLLGYWSLSTARWRCSEHRDACAAQMRKSAAINQQLNMSAGTSYSGCCND